MNSFALVLRGINVGGRRKILMAELKLALEKLGLKNCQSYIQSGNVVFQADNAFDSATLESVIANMILEKFGHEVPVIIISQKKLQAIVNRNPFAMDNDIKDLHCTFLKSPPSTGLLDNFNTLDYSPDQFEASKSAIYFLCGQKFSDSKMTNAVMEKKLGVSCTTRNWKTTLKILELVSNLDT